MLSSILGVAMPFGGILMRNWIPVALLAFAAAGAFWVQGQKSQSFKAGQAQEQLEQSAKSDEIVREAEQHNEAVSEAVETAQQSANSYLRDLDAKTFDVIRALPDLTKNNPGCEVPATVVERINSIK